MIAHRVGVDHYTVAPRRRILPNRILYRGGGSILSIPVGVYVQRAATNSPCAKIQLLPVRTKDVQVEIIAIVPGVHDFEFSGLGAPFLGPAHVVLGGPPPLVFGGPASVF